MSGFISVSRDMLKHPLVGAHKPKYYVAWSWLLAEARWKPGRVMIAGHMVELQRGQLSHSLRFMADNLPLSIKEMRTFLKHLQKEEMIRVENGHSKGHSKGTGQSVITICNYEKYQIETERTESDRAQQRAQQGHSRGTKKNKDEIRDNKVVVVDARAREAKPTLKERAEAAMAVQERCCDLIGVSPEKDPRWADCSEAMAWLAGGADPETDIYPTVKRLAANSAPRSMRYFTQAIADAKAARERPMPEGRAPPPQKRTPHGVLFSAAEQLYNDLIEEERENVQPTGSPSGNVVLIGTTAAPDH